MTDKSTEYFENILQEPEEQANALVLFMASDPGGKTVPTQNYTQNSSQQSLCDSQEGKWIVMYHEIWKWRRNKLLLLIYFGLEKKS